MKGIIQIRSNGSKWAGQKPDPISMLVERLRRLTLLPFSSVSECASGEQSYFGNFVEESAVFDVRVKRESEADKMLLTLFRANAGYKKVKKTK